MDKENLENKIKDTELQIYEKTPFTIDNLDVIKFNNDLEQEDYFTHVLKPKIKETTQAYIKNTNYLLIRGNKEDNKFITYIRFKNQEGFWYYAFVIDIEYINYNTTKIIFELDFWQTYHLSLDFDNISGIIEQGHIKRKNEYYNNVVPLNQGFDTGYKINKKTTYFNNNVTWLVFVMKSGTKLGSRKFDGTFSGTYKPYSYFLYPITEEGYGYSVQVGGVTIENTNLEDLIHELTNSFTEDTNTVNNCVNIYTTKFLGLGETLDKEPIALSNHYFEIVGIGSDSDSEIADDINPTNPDGSCPSLPLGKDSSKWRISATYLDPNYSVGGHTKHWGLDLSTKGIENLPIYAVRDGIVMRSEFNQGGFGNLLVIKHTNGDKYLSVYGHLNKRLVNVGDIVKQGQKIGLSGNTGRSTGPHLHFQLNTVNEHTFSGTNATTDPYPYLFKCVPKSSGNTDWQKVNVSSGLTMPNGNISVDNLKKLIAYCNKRNIKPSFALAQLYEESFWGNSSNRSKVENNWGGITYPGGGGNPQNANKRHRGSPRPRNEGGYYVKYDTIDVFFDDYTYLITHVYKVQGKTTLLSYCQALDGYAWGKGYWKGYYDNINAVYKAIAKRNPQFPDQIDKA